MSRALFCERRSERRSFERRSLMLWNWVVNSVNNSHFHKMPEGSSVVETRSNFEATPKMTTTSFLGVVAYSTKVVLLSLAVVGLQKIAFGKEPPPHLTASYCVIKIHFPPLLVTRHLLSGASVRPKINPVVIDLRSLTTIICHSQLLLSTIAIVDILHSPPGRYMIYDVMWAAFVFIR